jgi:hypothetical protein
VLGVTYQTNPADLVQPWANHIVNLCNMCAGEFGLAHLPDPGGLNDQSAWLMDAINICRSVGAKLSEAERDANKGHH